MKPLVLWHNVSKGSRQIRFLTSGKELALVVECMGLWIEITGVTCGTAAG